MTGFLLDSSFCVACLRRRPWALRALGSVPLCDVAVSSMTRGELLLGARLAADPAGEGSRVEAFLRPIPLIPFGREEASWWARIDASLRRQGNRIETEDAVIAATALAHRRVLVTGNARHFGRVEGLQVVDWERQPPIA